MINHKNIDAIFLDFDGVLTDNYAFIDEDGKESVKVSRSDGIAFKILKKINIPCYILSSEKNNVVISRARKLNIKCFKGVENKLEKLKKISNKYNYRLKKIIYLGNDINDLKVMKAVAYPICPKNSHNDIKKISYKVLKSIGGSGVVRELVEKIFKINIEEYY